MKRLLALFFTTILFLTLSSSPVFSASAPDFNSDGHVNSVDYTLFLAGFPSRYTLLDYAKIITNYGKSYSPSPSPVSPNQVNVGAIYWSGSPSIGHDGLERRNADEQVNSFPQFQYRLPYFSINHGGNDYDVHEDSQAVVDQEIQLASTAGLDYFSFLINMPPRGNNSVFKNYGLYKYISSSYKSKIKFNIIIASLHHFPTSSWNSVLTSWLIPYLQDPQYLTTPNNKLILNIFSADELLSKYPEDELQTAISTLKADIKTATGKDLFLVAMCAPNSAKKLIQLGFNSGGSYSAANGNSADRGSAYSHLALVNRTFWDSYKTAQTPIIPSVNVGQDARPRLLSPTYDRYAWHAAGTPEEIAANLQTAINFVKANPLLTPAKAVLIYAWNEFAEGGWLTPSLTDNNAKLNAISKVLGGKTMATPISPYIGQNMLAHPLGTVTITSPKSGSNLVANTPITITGTATLHAMIKLKMGSSVKAFVNGLGAPPEPNKDFSVQLPGLPAGTYDLIITGDITPLTIPNLVVK